jgi:DNA-binding protein HU-beta
MTQKTAEKKSEAAAPTMTGGSRDTLYRVVAGELNTSITQAKEYVNAVLNSIVTILLAQGDSDKPKLAISDFGTFNVKKVASRPGRNPITGEAVTCAPTVRISFKPSSTVKDKVITAVWAGKSRAVAVPAKTAPKAAVPAAPAIKPRAHAPVKKG